MGIGGRELGAAAVGGGVKEGGRGESVTFGLFLRNHRQQH